MNVKKLETSDLPDFLAYCRKHKYAHDESFLEEEDLENFETGNSNPTWILMDRDRMCGVLSLIADEYYLKGKRTRVRIFHTETTGGGGYARLLKAALPLNLPVEKMEMFLPDRLRDTKDIVTSLGFSYYRTSYVMIRREKKKAEPDFPDGFSLDPFSGDDEAEIYAEIRNRAFAELKGSETPVSRDDVLKQSRERSLLPGGMRILRDGDIPAGIVRMIRESDESGEYSFVAPIALIPEYQGKGLGRELLKAGIEIGRQNGLDNCMLVVNAENEQALKLYKGQDFNVDMAVSCYTLAMKKERES